MSTLAPHWIERTFEQMKEREIKKKLKLVHDKD